MKKIKKIILLLVVIAICICGYEVKLGYDKYTDALSVKSLDVAVEEIMSKPHYTVYDDIPIIYFNAVVATEDRRFYKHNGFDIIGTTRALLRDIKEKELLEGGSTISQQLAKNMYFPKDDTLQRKIAEVFMALKIEREYEKEEILEFYVNGIYYGSGYYCIYDAAKGYFNKKPKNLTLDECTILAGIPNAPSKYSLKVNPKLCYERQDKVLREMIKSGYITEDDREKIYYKHLKK